MNSIYELNTFTKTNILFYQTEEPFFIFERLLMDHLEDAILLYNKYKWKTIQCTNVDFLIWLKNNSIDVELTDYSIKTLITNGDKEVLDYIHPNDYIDTILTSTNDFIQYVLQHYSLVISEEQLIQYCKEDHIDNICLTLMNHCPTNESLVSTCLYYLCNYNVLPIIKQLLCKYPNITLKPLFYKAITNNHYDTTLYFLSIDHTLIYDINVLDCFMNHAYKTLRLLYILNKSLFSNINHNYVFRLISRHSPDPFIDWYLQHFRYYIDNNVYEENIALLHSKGYINGPITNEQFLSACLNNCLHSVQSYTYDDYDVIQTGFELSALYGHIEIVKYVCSYIEKPDLYVILHNLIELDSEYIDVVQHIYKCIEIPPPKLGSYFCKHGYIDDALELDSKCIYELCSNGHFECVYNLYVQCKIDDVEQCFIWACENGEGLFLAKWIYHIHPIPKKIICNAFFNSNDIYTLKWLYSLETIPIRQHNNAYFIERCLHHDYPILDWLCELYNHYSYIIIDNVLYYNIDLYKISGHIEEKECSICMETKSNSMTLCHHSFCYECINKWYKKNNSCPMCRSPIEEILFHTDDLG